MAKKPVKKPAKKKAPVPKKKPSVKAAAKGPKKVVKKAKPAKKAKPVKAAKPVKPAKAVKPIKVAKPVKVAAPKAPVKVPKGKAPIPEKVIEKSAKKGAKGKVADAVLVAAIETVEEEPVEELILTDAEGRRFCRVRDCDQLAAVETYCRYHYLLHWKKIQVRKKILTEGKLERYIEELTARYPDKFLDMLRKDLRSEKEFLGAIQELEIDESAMENDLEEEAQTYIDEVRGMEPTTRETEEDF